ncbi:MAG: hypothetical protein IKW51_07645, partial [Bacteroidales bacterium]|nr:hypothetical protein [Bacteroidales bacterium]
LWEQGVAGSNPATPTQKTKELQKCDSFFYLHKIMVEMVVLPICFNRGLNRCFNRNVMVVKQRP